MRSIVLKAVLAAGLSGCGAYDGIVGTDELPPAACPDTAVVYDASRLVRFRDGGGEAPADRNLSAEIRYATRACDVEGTDLVVSVGDDMVAEIGPAALAARQGRHQVPYFLAIADVNATILTNRVFNAPFAFTDKVQLARFERVDDVRLRLDGGKTGRDFKVYVGFELTREQLAYNRRTFSAN